MGNLTENDLQFNTTWTSGEAEDDPKLYFKTTAKLWFQDSLLWMESIGTPLNAMAELTQDETQRHRTALLRRANEAMSAWTLFLEKRSYDTPETVKEKMLRARQVVDLLTEQWAQGLPVRTLKLVSDDPDAPAN